MKGITFNQVREAIAELSKQIPATDEVCTEYSLSTGISEKDGEKDPFYFLIVKCGKIRISLHVYGTMLVSEGGEI